MNRIRQGAVEELRRMIWLRAAAMTGDMAGSGRARAGCSDIDLSPGEKRAPLAVRLALD
jgi:hypothetical protein